MSEILYINKPKGMTSFDVCYKLRKVLGTRSIGHTGTLDPNATGVMIILANKACKANQFLVKDTKEYIATVKLGVLTDSLDIDGEVIKEEAYIAPTKNDYQTAFNKFVGKITQIPPLTSAIKVNGKKLLDYKLEGKEVEIPSREVEVFYIDLLSCDNSGFVFKTKVSSGTYIRTLMKDILESMGLIGTLIELNRVKVGNVDINECDDFEEVLKGNYHTHELYDVLKDTYEVIDYKNPNDIKNGKRIKLNTNNDEVLIVDGKEVLAIYKREKDCIFKSVRGLF